MTDVIETILFFFFIWWVLQVLSRLVIPVTATNKKQHSGFNPFQQRQQEYKQKEGNTTIHLNSKTKSKYNAAEKGADYVDYEEVK